MSPTTPDDENPETFADARSSKRRPMGRLRRDRGVPEPFVEDDTDLWVRMITPDAADAERLPMRSSETGTTDITNTASALRRDPGPSDRTTGSRPRGGGITTGSSAEPPAQRTNMPGEDDRRNDRSGFGANSPSEDRGGLFGRAGRRARHADPTPGQAGEPAVPEDMTPAWRLSDTMGGRHGRSTDPGGSPAYPHVDRAGTLAPSQGVPPLPMGPSPRETTPLTDRPAGHTAGQAPASQRLRSGLGRLRRRGAADDAVGQSAGGESTSRTPAVPLPDPSRGAPRAGRIGSRDSDDEPTGPQPLPQGWPAGGRSRPTSIPPVSGAMADTNGRRGGYHPPVDDGAHASGALGATYGGETRPTDRGGGRHGTRDSASARDQTDWSARQDPLRPDLAAPRRATEMPPVYRADGGVADIRRRPEPEVGRETGYWVDPHTDYPPPAEGRRWNADSGLHHTMDLPPYQPAPPYLPGYDDRRRGGESESTARWSAAPVAPAPVPPVTPTPRSAPRPTDSTDQWQRHVSRPASSGSYASPAVNSPSAGSARAAARMPVAPDVAVPAKSRAWRGADAHEPTSVMRTAVEPSTRPAATDATAERPAHGDAHRRQQRLVVGVLVVVALVVLGGLAVTKVLHRPHHNTKSAAGPAATASGGPQNPVPSDIPTNGTGTFSYATTTSAVLGTTGTVQTFHVATEKGAETAHGGEDANAFAADVVQVLGDAHSWIAGKKVRFQQVPLKVKAPFTIYLATEATSERICATGGFHTDKLTSCHVPNEVVINLSRWMTSVDGYGASLDVYRAYDINHEIGRQLGKQNEACPGPGKPAPVMMQQALGLQGCVANPYPYPDGHTLYSGPVIP